MSLHGLCAKPLGRSPWVSPWVSPWAVIVLSLGLASTACRYDLDKLRLSDAAPLPDRTTPPMDAAEDTARDSTPPPADTPRDTPPPRDTPARPPRVGTCTSHPFTELVPQPAVLFGGTLVINGNTMMDTPMASSLMQPIFGVGCSTAMMNNAPERVFRYVVQRGPRLVASTNGAPCSGSFDTVLYAINTCDGPVTGSNVLDCNDDDVTMCGTCPVSVSCNAYLSTIEVGPVQAGDVVYLVVDGYNGTSGPFRLRVAENGAKPVAPPESALPNRCTCPALTGSTGRVITPGFPSASFDRGRAFRAAEDTISGLRPVDLRTVTAVSGQFRLGANNIAPMGSCATARAIVDLLVENTVVTSFQLSGVQESGATVQVMYSTFSPVMVQNRTMVSLAYKLRGFDPPSCLGSFEIDTMAPAGTNQLTLYGSPM